MVNSAAGVYLARASTNAYEARSSLARRTHLRLDLGGLALLRSGGDPIVLRKAKKAASRVVPTFGQLGDEVIEGKSTEWSNEKHRRQWKMTRLRSWSRIATSKSSSGSRFKTI
jgi:hypothetical protein